MQIDIELIKNFGFIKYKDTNYYLNHNNITLYIKSDYIVTSYLGQPTFGDILYSQDDLEAFLLNIASNGKCSSY